MGGARGTLLLVAALLHGSEGMRAITAAVRAPRVGSLLVRLFVF